jgi:3',5'-cyclic AMP phosphodiesterase CpdA
MCGRRAVGKGAATPGRGAAMKIVHLTDLHLGPKELVRFGANQHERLAAAIAGINRVHADAALCVITGDLADRGDRAAYEDLRTALAALQVPYALILGNHDRRKQFRATFPETAQTPGGFVQSVHDLGGVRLICLDTLSEGRVDGVLDRERLEWLDERLGEAAGRRTLIFMHHPPVAIGIPMLDPLALSEPGPFLDLLNRHGSVAHLFFGHVHRPVHGTVAGVPFTAQRGISVQFALDLRHRSAEAEAAPPAYGVILVEDASIVVHEEAFMAGWPRYDVETGLRLDMKVPEANPAAAGGI